VAKATDSVGTGMGHACMRTHVQARVKEAGGAGESVKHGSRPRPREGAGSQVWSAPLFGVCMQGIGYGKSGGTSPAECGTHTARHPEVAGSMQAEACACKQQRPRTSGSA